MYLSRIEIIGFKSFAQKIELTFDAGITAIVGPNGCGKTNVVDAIRWTLGEQRPTTLRSDKMEDVIFNGTKSRKPLGMAEVSLTIQNTRGILPTDFSEVTITRRVYRSGEGEYLLNKTLCRLKDIRDLFMDTGMGADAYSVIELKMVETILSDRAEERRRLFEEAAGVTKYKHRRKETYRRLESVQHDLVRVNDIVREVQKAVNSLERQAQKAEKYNESAKELHRLEIELLEREYSSLIQRSLPLKEQLTVAVDEKDKIDVGLKREEALVDVLRAELQDLEKNLQEFQNAIARQQGTIHQYEQTIATSTERKKALLSNIDRYEQEKVRTVDQRQKIEQAQIALTEQLRVLRSKLQEVIEAYDRKKSELDAYEIELNSKKNEFKAVQEKVITILHQIGDLKTQEGQIKARIDNLSGRIGYISEESERLRREVSENSELILKLTTEDRELRRNHAGAEVKVHKVEDEKTTFQKELNELREKEMELRGLIERKEARRDFLRGLVESYDGLSEGARHLISSEEWGTVIQTTVGEAFSIEDRLRIALESSLGESAGYVIVTSAEDAYAAIDYLKKSDKGKATFVCLNRVPNIEQRQPNIQAKGIIGWANQLISNEDRYKNLFKVLLSGTLIVENVSSAAEIVKQEAGIRCVTMDGEIITDKGLLRGGSTRQDEGKHINRRSQLEELSEEIKQIQSLRSDMLQRIGKKNSGLNAIDVKKFSAESRSFEQQMIAVEVKIAQLEFEKRRGEEIVSRNNEEIERLTKEVTDLQNNLESFLPKLQLFEQEKTGAEQSLGSIEAQLETMEPLWSEYSQKTNEANLEVVTLQSEERSIRQTIEHNLDLLTSLQQTYEQRTQDIIAAKEEIEILEKNLSETKENRKIALIELESSKRQKEEIDEKYGTKRSEVYEIELRLKDERLRHEGSLKSSHDLEFKLQELTMRADGLKNRANEEFDLELQVKEFEDPATFDFAATREEVRILKEKLRALGAINFAAYDEYKSEKERLDFVNAQRKDLEESEKTLLETIEEINTTAQRKFTETFELIRENFIKIFKSLFDEGDECNLGLEEGVDPLEARIEITAKPRGKRPTSIDLLSGGEKTLTAIALLFAIYLVKPSPFCILDEVDAPLDDNNIDRFTKILNSFSDNTQFIIVTHNKRTMESANALYGVTMEEEGVSKLVSVRIDNAVVVK